jgi:uncharacterized protein (TIGR00251 family)
MIISVKVYPSSGREEIVRINDKEYKVYLKKPAEDGKANIELLKVLKRHAKKSPEIFGAVKTKNKQGFYGFKVEIKIIKGLTSRNKIIKIGD